MKRLPVLLAPLALSVALVACDSRDYEGEITNLETELESARTELEAAMAERETLTGELEQLRGQGMGEEGRQQVEEQLTTAMQLASQTYERMGALANEPDAPVERRTEAYGVLREDLQEVIASIQAAGEQLGIEMEEGAPTTQQQGGAAAPQGQQGQATQPGAAGGAQPPQGGQQQ